MPAVTRENIGLLNEKITVTVNKEDYLPSFEKALKHYAKSASIPGFRKGMVPSGVIKKMHGPSVFTDEVLRSIEKGLMDYLNQEKLDIFAQPLPAPDNDARHIDMNQPKDYSFVFEIGLKPAFEIPDLQQKAPVLYKVKVTDEMIEEEVNRLQQRLGKMTEPESISQDDNVLNVKFEECDAEGNVAEGTTAKENSLLVKYFTEGFRKQLMGRKKDDALVLQLKDAFEEKEREWLISDLGLSKDDNTAIEKFFKMTIVKLGFVEKRELNEEFFKEVYPGKEILTEADFRNEIKNEIQQYWDKQSRSHMQHDLYHVLLDHTTMEFPENFLKRWLQTGGDKPKTAEQAEEEFPVFKDQLKWTLLTDKIVKENNINVSGDELKTYMKQQVMGYFGSMNMEGNLDWLDSYVERMMKDEQQVDSSYRRLLTQKIFEWAETKVTPSEKEITAEEFNHLQQEHQHHHH
jgi:trigger factor